MGHPLSSQEALQPGSELPRRPVCEGDGSDLPRLYPSLLDEPGGPGGQTYRLRDRLKAGV